MISSEHKVYLVGPMRGIEEYNFPRFLEVADLLRAQGFTVVNPAELDLQAGHDPRKEVVQTLAQYMERDLPALLGCDSVITLEGWEDSEGAQLEVHVARACGIPIYSSPEMNEYIEAGDGIIPPLEKCWCCGRGIAPRNPDPWEGRMDGYCLSCSLTRCDTSYAVCAVKDSQAETDTIRRFDTGATRDTETGKYDYEGFLSPLMLRRFGEYMHEHRVQPDGSLRDSDNWQRGIPLDAYMKSMLRHVFDVWALHRGYDVTDFSSKPVAMEDALCGALFNVQGYLHELLKGAPDVLA